MVSIHDADISISELSLSEIHAMSTEIPNTEKVTGLFTCFADPDVPTGNLHVIFIIFREFFKIILLYLMLPS